MVSCADETLPGASTYNYSDPQSYFAQHLLGFFRGGAVNRQADKAQLTVDIHALSVSNSVSVIGRDVQLLKSIGSAVTSSTFAQFLSTYESALPQIAAGTASTATVLTQPRR